MDDPDTNSGILRGIRVHVRTPHDGWRRRGSEEKKMQYYTVKHDDGEEEISVETGRGRQGWMTLGSFYFSAGEAKITLSDKGSDQTKSSLPMQ